MDKFNQLIKQEMAVLDQVIRQDLGSQVPLVNTVGEYIIAGGGKRIRPLLTILCGKVLDNQLSLIHISEPTRPCH
jgi:octaprenyl-diphosphate synthase